MKGEDNKNVVSKYKTQVKGFFKYLHLLVKTDRKWKNEKGEKSQTTLPNCKIASENYFESVHSNSG